MSDENKNFENHIVNGSEDDEIHLLDLVVILTRHKRIVIGMPLLTGLIALVTSFVIAPTFTSTARLMPPQQQQSSGVAAMLGQLGGLAGAAGGIAGIKNPNDLYIGLLESRTVQDSLITRLNLKDRYKASTMTGARKTLAANSDIGVGKKDGIIAISVRDENPQFAADLANAYVEELVRLNQSMALTEASQRRLFFEKQLRNAKDELANAEVALRATQEKTGMLEPDSQVQAIIANAAQIKATIAAKEVQLSAMRTYAAIGNPELMRTEEELRGLQRQLAKLESSRSGHEGDFMVPTGKIPEVGVSYVRSVRNVKYYETIFELLAKQFELAKIDEAKDSSIIQVLDKAIPADQRTAPRRSIITALGVFGGFIAGVLLAFANSAYVGARQNPANAGRWQRLNTAWRRHSKKSVFR
jgi:tyrosine-protein kinase Etk/Wzc